MKTVSRIFITLIFLVGLSVNVFANNDEWEYKEWKVEKIGNLVRYATHGSVVWGHKFGFLKRINDCSFSNLWVSLSSSFGEVKEFEGGDAILKLDIDGIVSEIKVQLSAVYKPELLSYHLMAFTNYVPDNDFIDLLKKGHKLELTVVEPKQLVKYLDVNGDVFNLNGFIASRLKANEYCEELAKRNKSKSLAYQAMLHQQHDDLELAISEYKKAIDLYPEDGKAVCNLGLAYAEQGKLEEAIKCYEKAIKLMPKDFRAYFNLGVAYHNLGIIHHNLKMEEESLKYVEILNKLGFEKEARALKRLISSNGMVVGDPTFD